jgi:hypothetical protein
MLIGAIQDFDEISGTLTFTSSFIFFWNDEIRRWDPEDYGGIYITKLPILDQNEDAPYLQTQHILIA